MKKYILSQVLRTPLVYSGLAYIMSEKIKCLVANYDLISKMLANIIGIKYALCNEDKISLNKVKTENDTISSIKIRLSVPTSIVFISSDC